MRGLLLSYGLLIFVGWIDYWSGYEVRLGTFYLLTVAFAAWKLRKPASLALYVILMVAIWTSASQLSGQHFSRGWVKYWNTLNLLGSVSITAGASWMIKRTVDAQRRLIRELRKTMLDARQLRELVPVCRICNTMRDDAEYQALLKISIEESEGSEALGGVCPNCVAARAQRLNETSTQGVFSDTVA